MALKKPAIKKKPIIIKVNLNPRISLKKKKITIIVSIPVIKKNITKP